MITPILLCGGSGTRLWPLSRKSYPKQFSALMGAESLFQATARRLSGPAYAAPIIITASDFRFIVTEQLAEIGIDPGAILIEPEGRNTAPAVLAAALYAQKTNPDALLLVAPSDHVIPDVEAFDAAVNAGLQVAQAGDLVTFGIHPERPETGYGYLELAEAPRNAGPVRLKQFVEKPDEAKAKSMLATERYLWNSGIFLFSAEAILTAFNTHAAGLVAPVTQAVEAAKTDLGFLRLDPASWANADSISIDYAVMEHADNLSVVPFSAGWSDLGDWAAVWRENGADDAGVTLSGAATAIECQNTMLRSESPDLELVGIGLDNIIVVAMLDAVLVANREDTQNVKLAVDRLKEKQAQQAVQFPRDHRPWGWFETLVVGDRFRVKRIVVHPGGALSLQSHMHRSEHWVVVEGTALVTIGTEKKLVSENQSVYIPVGDKHRLENPGKVPMALIEVQTGPYLGEDDIVRYEDTYART